MNNEIWKAIKNYEGFYEVSSEGRVRSVERLDARGQHRKSKVISIKNIRSSKQVTLFRDGKRKNSLVKKLVADTFLEAPQANEKLIYVDGNPENNCVENLKWQKKAQRKRNVYRFEDNKTGEIFEGSISDCCDAWGSTPCAVVKPEIKKRK